MCRGPKSRVRAVGRWRDRRSLVSSAGMSEHQRKQAAVVGLHPPASMASTAAGQQAGGREWIAARWAVLSPRSLIDSLQLTAANTVAACRYLVIADGSRPTL